MFSQHPEHPGVFTWTDEGIGELGQTGADLPGKPFGVAGQAESPHGRVSVRVVDGVVSRLAMDPDWFEATELDEAIRVITATTEEAHARYRDAVMDKLERDSPGLGSVQSNVRETRTDTDAASDSQLEPVRRRPPGEGCTHNLGRDVDHLRTRLCHHRTDQ